MKLQDAYFLMFYFFCVQCIPKLCGMWYQNEGVGDRSGVGAIKLEFLYVELEEKEIAVSSFGPSIADVVQNFLATIKNTMVTSSK